MFGIGILIYMHFQNHNLLTNPLKKLLIIALLIVGCGNNAISNVSSVLIDIFIIDGKCKSIIYRYNDLQEENKKLVLDKFLSNPEINEKEFVDVIKMLVKVSPKFTHLIFEIYVNAYCDGKLKSLLPISISEFYRISKNTFAVQKELLEGFHKLSKSSKVNVLKLFSKFT